MFTTELECIRASCAWTKHRLAEPDNMYNISVIFFLKKRQKRIQFLIDTARKIHHQLCTDVEYARIIAPCSDPRRAMIMNNKIIDGNTIDGTWEYHLMVDELERLEVGS